jgi:hypothetical protein
MAEKATVVNTIVISQIQKIGTSLYRLLDAKFFDKSNAIKVIWRQKDNFIDI